MTFWTWLRDRRRRWLVVVVALALLAAAAVAWELFFVYDALAP